VKASSGYFSATALTGFWRRAMLSSAPLFFGSNSSERWEFASASSLLPAARRTSPRLS
jgi:hypothetical protein